MWPGSGRYYPFASNATRVTEDVTGLDNYGTTRYSSLPIVIYLKSDEVSVYF